MVAAAAGSSFRVLAKRGDAVCEQTEELLKSKGEAYEMVYDHDSTSSVSPQIYKGQTYVGTHQDLQCHLLEEDEPVLSAPQTYTMVPVNQDLWAFYKKAVASFWTPEEIDFSTDLEDWEKLSDDERHFISYVLAFFAGSDGIVNENLIQNFCSQVRLPEVTAFYTFQAAMETIHSETYALLIETYIRDEAEKAHLFNAIEEIDGVARKANWAIRWITNGCSFHQRLIAFACVEGIMFSGSFCAIFWLKKRGLLKGLTFSNELISRDEGMHQDFACQLYNKLTHKLSTEVVHNIVREAVECETHFITEALPCSLIGMNADLMTQYIQYVADRMLTVISYPKIWNVENPFTFMNLISLETKGNFFEVRNSQYSRSQSANAAFEVDDDF